MISFLQNLRIQLIRKEHYGKKHVVNIIITIKRPVNNNYSVNIRETVPVTVVTRQRLHKTTTDYQPSGCVGATIATNRVTWYTYL